MRTESITPTKEVFLLLSVEGRLWIPSTAGYGAGATLRARVPRSLQGLVGQASCFRGYEGIWGLHIPSKIALEVGTRGCQGEQGAVASPAAAVGVNQAGRRRG